MKSESFPYDLYSVLNYSKKTNVMNRVDFRDISHARIAARIKQVLVLFLAVVVGMLISIFVNV